MNIKRKLTLILIVLAFSILSLNAKPSDRVVLHSNEVTALERTFFNAVDSKNRNININELFDGAIIASSITNQSDFNRYKTKLNKIRSDAKSYMQRYSGRSKYDRGQLLLTWLYDTSILKKYGEYETSMAGLLDYGNYNCVSSAILYGLLCQENGISAMGVFSDAEEHVFVVVSTEKGNIDVETTNEYGFEPGVRYADGGDSEKTYYRDRETRPMLALLGQLYENMSAEAEKGYNRPNINNLATEKKGFYLDPLNKGFQDNMLVEYYNAAWAYMDKNQYANAKKVIDEALKFDPNDSDMRDTLLNYYNNYLVGEYNALIRNRDANRLQNAKNITAEGLRLFPNDRNLREHQRDFNNM